MSDRLARQRRQYRMVIEQQRRCDVVEVESPDARLNQDELPLSGDDFLKQFRDLNKDRDD